MSLRYLMNPSGWLVSVVATIAMTLSQPCAATEPVDIGARRELFIDRHLIDQLRGADLRLAIPQSAGTVLRFDKPWEGLFSAYVTVLKSPDGILQLYYRGKPTESEDGHDEYTCYAQSKDGINWEKPELGIVEIEGNKRNNVILAEQPFAHNFTPFLDTRPDVPSEQRYKALAGTARTNLVAYVSPDGTRWKRLREEPIFRDVGWVFDSQNVSFWSESEQCYVLFYRKTVDHVRNIARATSKDFVTWSQPTMMSYSQGAPTQAEQFYTNQTHPYFRAPHIYISTPARFMAGLVASVHGSIPSADWKQHDCSDTVLMTSRGGGMYERTFREAFVRPGPGATNWTSRTNYAALGIVQTGEAEMSIYLQRHYGFGSNQLERLTLRLDGFASIHAPYDGGEAVTQPLTFSGKMLEINYSTSAAGALRVEIQDEQGKPIDGYSLADAETIIGDEINRTVAWKNGSDVSALKGRVVRLRFVMKDADVYSLRFAP
jgi:hypothetical protein